MNAPIQHRRTVEVDESQETQAESRFPMESAQAERAGKGTQHALPEDLDDRKLGSQVRKDHRLLGRHPCKDGQYYHACDGAGVNRRVVT